MQSLASTTVVPFRVIRRMSTAQTSKAFDPGYWAAQIHAVALRRDVDSFMRIYDFYAPRLQRYLLGLSRSDNAVEELVQESMLRVWLRADTYNAARSNVNTWIFRIARNLFIDRVRSEPAWCPIQEGIDLIDEQSMLDGASRIEFLPDEDKLRLAIHALPAMQARLIRMAYLEAKTHSEISRELAMPLGSVKSTLRRALGKLQLAMRQGS